MRILHVVGRDGPNYEELKASPPDVLVFRDPGPDVRTLELFRKVRGDPALAQIYIVSWGDAYPNPEHPTIGPRSGADVYLAGPLSEEDWQARVRDWKRMRRYQMVLDSAVLAAGLGWWDYDISTGHLEWSSATYEIFGLKPEEFSHTLESFHALVHPEDLPSLNAVFQRALENRGPLEERYRIIRPDGQIRLILDRGEVEFDDRGRPLRTTGVVVDVTEKSQREEALQRSEERYRLLVETCQAAIWSVNRELRLNFVNEGSQKVYGRAPAELIGVFIGDLLTPEQFSKDSAIWAQALATGTPSVQYESAIKHKDGTLVSVLINAVEIRDSQGKFQGYTGTATDIRASKRAQERLRLALEAAQVGEWELDLGSNTSQRSLRHDQIFGYAEGLSEWNLDSFLAHVHPADHYAVKETFAQALKKGNDWSIECRILPKNQSLRWIWAWGSVERDQEGKPVRTLGLIGDITQRKESETQLRLLSTSMSRLNDVVIITKSEPVVLPGPKIVYVNDAFIRLTGYSREETIGKTPRILQGPKTDRATLDRIHQALLEGRSVREEIINYKKNGEEYWLELAISPVVDDLGWYSHLVAVERDITERKQFEAQLMASEANYRHVFEGNPLPLWVYELETLKLVAVNQATVEHYGYSRDELLSMGLPDLHPREERHLVENLVKRNSGERRRHPGLLLQQKKDGTLINVDVTTYDVDFNARPARLVLANDVTERLRSETSLRESDERFRLLSKVTVDAIWDWNLTTNAMWWNEGIETLFGYRRDCVESGIESWYNRIHLGDRDRIVSDIASSLSSGSLQWTGEHRFQRADGTFAFVLARGHVIYDRKGKPLRMVGGMTDLSERKAAEEKIEEQAALLDKAQDAIIVRDLKGQVLYWNKSAERLYGWADHEIRSQDFNRVCDRDPLKVADATSAVVSQGDWAGELEQVHRSGAKLLVESRWTLVRDVEGEPRSVLAINTDITEKKKLEQQSLRSQRMESIGTLAGGISHDLNNVLAPIILSTELLKSELPNSDLLTTIETSARRGADLVRQVLSFARGVEGTLVSLDVRMLIGELANLVRETFPRHLALVTHVSDDLWTVLGDPTQLHQVLLNLCLNARDATPCQGVLTINAQNLRVNEGAELAPGLYVWISVRDTGTGMSDEVQSKIFEPFYTTKMLGQGTGLGLSTVQAIVQGHHGQIRVDSQLGQGTTFNIYLPPSLAPKSAPPPRGARPQGSGETVLVVDDEQAIRSITTRLLERYGYRVVSASDGSEALAVYEREAGSIAVVLTDMMMPGMDGGTLIKILRERNPALKFIAASGLVDVIEIEPSIGFLAKPYSTEDLLKTLKDMLDSGAGDQG